MRRAITRLAYCTGMRRCPSCTNTIPATTTSTRKGIITLNTWSCVVHHVCTPLGRRATMEAKISSEIPLPMPFWVINSPIHINSTQPERHRQRDLAAEDRKSTRLNSSHRCISYAVFCLKKKNRNQRQEQDTIMIAV